MIGAVFVDGANLAYSLGTREKVPAPRRIRYAALIGVLRAMTAVDGRSADFRFKCYYGTYRDEIDRARRERFFDSLKRAGWTVFLAPSRLYGDGSYKDKGVDIQIALDAFDVCVTKSVEVLALVSHDSDFAPLFRKLPPAVHRYVLGWEHRMPHELPEVAKLISLDSIYHEIAYSGGLA